MRQVETVDLLDGLVGETVATPMDGAEQVGTIIPSRDLGVSFDEPASLELLESDFNVYRREGEDGQKHFTIDIDHVPLESAGLLAFLKEVAPFKDGDPADFSAQAVHNDWRMPDSAELERRLKGRGLNSGDRNILLEDLHETMGESWHDFLQSLSSLTDTLTGEAGFSHRYNYLYFFCKSNETSPNADLDDLFVLAKANFRTLADLSTILTLAGVVDAEEATLQAAHRATRYRDEPLKITEQSTPADFSLGQMGKGDIEMTLAQLEKLLTNEQLADVYAIARIGAYHQLKINNRTYFARRKGMIGTLRENYEQRRRMIQGAFDVEVMDIQLLERDGEAKPSEPFRIPGTEVRLADTVRMAPLISWVKTERARNFELPRYVRREPSFAQVDGMLGVLATAYVSPELRSRWRKVETIGRKSQEIGPAQVPVQALMKRKQLLGSALIRRAEKL